jgi:hypothetical protein
VEERIMNIVEVFKLIPPDAKYQIPLQNVQQLAKTMNKVYAVYFIREIVQDDLLYLFDSREKAQEYIEHSVTQKYVYDESELIIRELEVL